MAKRYYEGPVSDHFDGMRFFNHDSRAADKSLLDVLRWKIRSKAQPWPRVVPATAGLKPEASVAGLRLTHIGHSSLLIQANGTNMLLDPVWAKRASPLRWLGPDRRNAPAVAFNDLPPIHAVLITHNHYDHMDLDTVRTLWKRHRPRILTPLGNDAILRKGFRGLEVEAGDWWQSFALAEGLRVTIVPAYHWSSRGTGDYRKALWGGFVLETPHGVVYCAGDTAYRDGAIFREVRARFGPPLVAVLPIGAYAPRYFMKPQHADPEEAVQIARDCGARHALGVHWGTFPLSDEPFEEPAERFVAALEGHGGGRPLRPGDVWEPGVRAGVGGE